MIDVVQILQVLSGVLWLFPAFYLSRNIVLAFSSKGDRTSAILARNSFLSWLMAGYVLRWVAWPGAMDEMGGTELVAWAALYALSCVCAVWFFRDALNTAKAR